MYDVPRDLPEVVVNELGNWSDQVAPLIAALVRKHRLPVMVLMVLTVMDKVGVIDRDADAVNGE